MYMYMYIYIYIYREIYIYSMLCIIHIDARLCWLELYWYEVAAAK